MKDGSLNKENEVSKFSLLNNSLQTLVNLKVSYKVGNA